jgi:hypothetical protein
MAPKHKDFALCKVTASEINRHAALQAFSCWLAGLLESVGELVGELAGDSSSKQAHQRARLALQRPQGQHGVYMLHNTNQCPRCKAGHEGFQWLLACHTYRLLSDGSGPVR